MNKEKINRLITNNNLTLEAKIIYLYFISIKNKENKVSVPISKIKNDLDISSDRFYRHRELLIKNKCIEVIKKREKGMFTPIVYKIKEDN